MAFVDIEGNFDDFGRVPDQNRYSGVVEVSAIIVEWPSLKIEEIFHTFVKPLGLINIFVQRNIHGLSPNFLNNKPS